MLISQARLSDGSLATPDAIDAMRDHALEAYPHEAVGYIDAAGAYHRLENCADDPTQAARVDPGIIADLLGRDAMRAFYHSHPDGPDCPSQRDMISQQSFDLPFIICATNGQATAEPFAWGDDLVDDRPLIGRAFRHGVDDCYSMIRAWWRVERGVLLPDFARQWAWWEDQPEGIERDLYQRHFADAGFYPIPAAEAREGDVWLAAMRSAVPNHAGILLDRGLALHHAGLSKPHDATRLSRRDPVARWLPHLTHWLRRDIDPDDSSSRQPRA